MLHEIPIAKTYYSVFPETAPYSVSKSFGKAIKARIGDCFGRKSDAEEQSFTYSLDKWTTNLLNWQTHLKLGPACRKKSSEHTLSYLWVTVKRCTDSCRKYTWNLAFNLLLSTRFNTCFSTPLPPCLANVCLSQTLHPRIGCTEYRTPILNIDGICRKCWIRTEWSKCYVSSGYVMLLLWWLDKTHLFLVGRGGRIWHLQLRRRLMQTVHEKV